MTWSRMYDLERHHCGRQFAERGRSIHRPHHRPADALGLRADLRARPGSQIRNLDNPQIRNSHRFSPAPCGSTTTLAVDALLYLFFAPHSYTGEDLAEIHVCAGPVIVEALRRRICWPAVCRPAGPGEFTARAYLNGKLDLAQAEAVNEVISSSNRLQLEAAERLLGGRLTKAADEIRSALLDVLSLIEAGLDFSGEDIEFIGHEQAAERLAAIQREPRRVAGRQHPIRDPDGPAGGRDRRAPRTRARAACSTPCSAGSEASSRRSPRRRAMS